MATAFFAAGAAVVALALGLIPADPAKLEAPRWVIASAGLMFVAAGFVPLGQRCGFPDIVNQLVGLAAATGLAVVFNWIAFFPGERHFTGTNSILGFHLWSNSGGELTGRFLFGLFAGLVDAMVIVGLWRLVRALVHRAAPGQGE